MNPDEIIDHDILYSDDVGIPTWQRLVKQSNSREHSKRRYARKKMRKVVKDLLHGVRPRFRLDE